MSYHNSNGPSKRRFDPETAAMSEDVLITPDRLSKMMTKKDEKKSKPVVYGSKGNEDHPLMRPQIILVQGRTGSGKSTAVFSLLNEILEAVDPQRCNKAMFYSGSDGDPLLRRLNPEYVEVFSSKESAPFLDNIRELMSHDVPDAEKRLTPIIIDDAVNDRALAPDKSKGSLIGDLAVSHRHCGAIIIYVCQRYSQVPAMLRVNASRVISFSGSTKSEAKSLSRDLPFEQGSIEKGMSLISNRPHEFIMFNVPERTITRGFNQVLFK